MRSKSNHRTYAAALFLALTTFASSPARAANEGCTALLADPRTRQDISKFIAIQDENLRIFGKGPVVAGTTMAGGLITMVATSVRQVIRNQPPSRAMATAFVGSKVMLTAGVSGLVYYWLQTTTPRLAREAFECYREELARGGSFSADGVPSSATARTKSLSSQIEDALAEPDDEDVASKALAAH